VNPRRYLAAFCLVLVLFQSGGYYAVMEILKRQLSEQTALKIATEKTPLGGQLVFRIPVTSDKDDHFTFEGQVYQVIDRHVYEGTLYVVSVRDASATSAQENIESYAQSLAGKSGDTKAGLNLFENLAKYFCNEEYGWVVAADGWSLTLSFSINADDYEFDSVTSLLKPPTIETALA